eukprot:CAMPEP_0202692814 /NCGR_PEP_ID=MMETSP1385-20130828/7106_1 /ASSEMBLY_ACC=CAM_ASM_000861 /TAXON_ID=933848 /ORGANISM="Elphidium margaritaceum" /LENGTH=40 /DNA_ID= /DNA_START= /DNA_END= /DNA_ORIENTATION=
MSTESLSNDMMENDRDVDSNSSSKAGLCRRLMEGGVRCAR